MFYGRPTLSLLQNPTPWTDLQFIKPKPHKRTNHKWSKRQKDYIVLYTINTDRRTKQTTKEEQKNNPKTHSKVSKSQKVSLEPGSAPRLEGRAYDRTGKKEKRNDSTNWKKIKLNWINQPWNGCKLRLLRNAKKSTWKGLRNDRSVFAKRRNLENCKKLTQFLTIKIPRKS